MNVLPIIERLIVITYHRWSSESSVNGERLVLFTEKGRDIENIPPTQDALAQHVLRVGYEAGHVCVAKQRLKPHSYEAQQTLGGHGRWLMSS